MALSPRIKIEELSPIMGLDVSDPGEYLFTRYSPDLKNVSVVRGIIMQRQGGDVLGSSMGEQVMGIGQLQSPSGASVIRVGLVGADLLEQSTGEWATILEEGVSLTGTTDTPVCFAFPVIAGVGRIAFTNYADPIQVFSGSGTCSDLAGSPPKCKFMVSFGGYLFLAYVNTGVTEYSQRVQWSDVGDPEEWATGESGAADLLDDDETITGMHIYGSGITVHKNSSIYYGFLVPSDNVVQFDRKETGAGAVANGSIQNLPNGQQIYLAKDGFHLFNGVTAPLIPSPINDEIRDEMSPAQAHMASSVIVRELDEYWCAVPVGTSLIPDVVYKYNWAKGVMFRDSYPGISTMAIFRKTEGRDWNSDTETWDSDPSAWNSIEGVGSHPRVIFGYSDGETVERTTSSNDGSSLIESYWCSRDFTAKDFKRGHSAGTMVRWQELHVWCAGNSVDLEYSTDEGFSWERVLVATNSNTLALSSQFPQNGAAQVGYFDVESDKVRFRMKNYRSNETWKMKQFMVWGIPLEERQ